MGGIFISYRRGDSGLYAGRLRDTLSNHFGAEHIFRDIDTIDPGERFPRVIEQAVGSCDALVALIGPTWLTIADDAGPRRLDNPDDYVRLEIATALDRGDDVLVIPVLLGPTSMPAAADLPKPLASLAERNALRLTDQNWDDHAARLTKALEKVVKPHVVGIRSRMWGAIHRRWTWFDAWQGRVPAPLWQVLKIIGIVVGFAMTTTIAVLAIAYSNSGNTSQVASRPSSTTTATMSMTATTAPPTSTTTTAAVATTSAQSPSIDTPREVSPSAPSPAASAPPEIFRDGEGNLYVKIGDKIYRCDEIKQTYASGHSVGSIWQSELSAAALGLADAGITNPKLVADLPAGAQIATGAPTPDEILATKNAWDQQCTTIGPDFTDRC